MDKQELIEKYELELKDVQLKFGSSFKTKVFEEVLEDLKQLDDPEPIKLRDVIARIKQLDIGTRKVWLDEFLNELGGDYGTLKYKDGYEQGKLEGSMVPYDEPQKVQVPEFVADWIFKAQLIDRRSIRSALETATIRLYAKRSDEVIDWLKSISNQDIFVSAWANDYEVEQEKRYLVKMKGMALNFRFLKYNFTSKNCYMGNDSEIQHARLYHTRKELEEAGFGEVFDSQLFEVEEVE